MLWFLFLLGIDWKQIHHIDCFVSIQILEKFMTNLTMLPHPEIWICWQKLVILFRCVMHLGSWNDVSACYWKILKSIPFHLPNNIFGNSPQLLTSRGGEFFCHAIWGAVAWFFSWLLITLIFSTINLKLWENFIFL